MYVPKHNQLEDRAAVHRAARRAQLVAVRVAPPRILPPAPEDLRIAEVLARLEAGGYERVEAVVEVGQWSLRGGIVDIFSPARERPVRVEFFGDEVESLRLFDPTSQRSVEELSALAVGVKVPVMYGLALLDGLILSVINQDIVPVGVPPLAPKVTLNSVSRPPVDMINV